MAKAAWANQSFKKADRKKYADGGEVTEKMDLGGSSYADNSGGTWGEMGSRALDKRRDDDATREINKVTSETTKAHDDDEGPSITDSFKTDTTEADRAREDRGFVPAKEASVAPRTATKSEAPKAAEPKYDDQAGRALKREDTKKESFADQVSRKMDRVQRTFTGKLTAAEKQDAAKGMAAAAKGMGSDVRPTKQMRAGRGSFQVPDTEPEVRKRTYSVPKKPGQR